ncbi:NTP transferase domain-containing protein (plasmid) [Sinorhizobium meliloti]|uniref:phosphocholine cytidylyltransferase family protein n=1 Tax=Rhizobium meliloti TaxID=382 RepID=UPI001F1A91F6|nr:NTP transferase domain-containing protein [Sinorhizobium meliloti]
MADSNHGSGTTPGEYGQVDCHRAKLKSSSRTGHNMSEAIILAAGMGRRLGHLTANRPKALIEVAGEPLVSRLLSQMQRAGVSNVTVVVGFLGDEVIAHVRSTSGAMNIDIVENPRYRSENNITSLGLALVPGRALIVSDCDVFLSDFPDHWLQPDGADITVPTRPLRPRETGTVLRRGMDGEWYMVVTRNCDETLPSDRKTISLYLLRSKEFVLDFHRKMTDAISGGETALYYEDILARSLGSKYRLGIIETESFDVTAFEIDTLEDLEAAESWVAAAGTNWLLSS